MKTYGDVWGVNVKLQTFLNFAVDGGFYPPPPGLDVVTKRNIPPLAGNWSPLVQPVVTWLHFPVLWVVTLAFAANFIIPMKKNNFYLESIQRMEAIQRTDNIVRCSPPIRSSCVPKRREDRTDFTTPAPTYHIKTVIMTYCPAGLFSDNDGRRGGACWIYVTKLHDHFSYFSASKCETSSN
jgi:hypothetical protein